MDKSTAFNAEEEKIQTDIRNAVNNLVAGCETLNMDLAFEAFSDSPDFLMMGTDGSLCDYRTYIDNNIGYLEACSAFKLTTHRYEIRILNPVTAIYSWAYSAEATLKTGEQDIVENAGASFVFNKIKGTWKVVYYHESSTPPKRVEKTLKDSGMQQIRMD